MGRENWERRRPDHEARIHGSTDPGCVCLGLRTSGAAATAFTQCIAGKSMDEAGAQVAQPLAMTDKMDLGALTATAATVTDGGSAVTVMPDRYLIKNATIAIEVADARKAGDALVSAVRDAGGHVAGLRETRDGLGHLAAVIEIRVPASTFETTMVRLDALGKVLDRQVTTQDVTEEFVDASARLRTMKRTEERILDHLNRTAKLEDILKVEGELGRYRERIEQLEGRLRFLQDRVAFSTIKVTLSETPKAESPVPPETFSTAQVASEASRALVGFAQALWLRAIWIAIWTPVWAPLTAAAWAIVVWTRRSAARQQAGRTNASG